MTHAPAQPTCAWCRAPLDDRAATGGDIGRFGVARCSRCGVGTTTPWPDDDELRQAYQRYRPDDGRFSGVGDRLLWWSRGRIARRIDQLAPPGPILDVGAGDGALVSALSARGRIAVGVERTGDVDVDDEPVKPGANDYAAVVFWHSLEHLRQPADALAAAAAALSPGGVLIVAVPNWASLQARVFGKRWFALDLPRHLVHIPAASLLRSLGELGLEVRRVSQVRAGQIFFGWLEGLVASVPGNLRLYDSIRRPAARSAPLGAITRWITLGTAVVLAPVAALCALVEVVSRRGGSIYVEAVAIGRPRR